MLIAGPNLTIDRTAVLAQLQPGEVLRFDRVVVTPGGKGLNVARAARATFTPLPPGVISMPVKRSTEPGRRSSSVPVRSIVRFGPAISICLTTLSGES